MTPVHEWVYQLDEGIGGRFVKSALLLIAVSLLVGFYSLRVFTAWHDAEALDQAQIARNLAQGKGFTTGLVRPFALYLQQKAALEQKKLAVSHATRSQEGKEDDHLAVLWPDPLPDISNPPAYPLLLAGVLKVTGAGVNPDKFFLGRSVPDLVINAFNLLLFLGSLVLLYGITKIIFDERVALFATLVFAFSEVFWLLTISGLATMWLVFLTLMLFRTLVAYEAAYQDGAQPGWGRQLSLALLLGLLVGVGALSKYAYLAMVLPVAVFLSWVTPSRKWLSLAGMLMVVGTLLLPWLWRNNQLCGEYFGTSAYAVYQETPQLPGQDLMQTLDPPWVKMRPDSIVRKAMSGMHELITKDLPMLGSSWISLIFWAGLFVPFAFDFHRRLRGFLLMAAASMALTQMLGRTGASAELGLASADNLLVVLAPLGVAFGMASLSKLFRELEQFEKTGPLICGPVLVFFAILPLIASAFTVQAGYAKSSPWSLSSLRILQKLAQPGAILTGQAPAVVWYSQKTAIWRSHDIQKDIQCFEKSHPLAGLYLTGQAFGRDIMVPMLTGNRQGGAAGLSLCLFGHSPVAAALPPLAVYVEPVPGFLLHSTRAAMLTATNNSPTFQVVRQQLAEFEEQSSITSQLRPIPVPSPRLK